MKPTPPGEATANILWLVFPAGLCSVMERMSWTEHPIFFIDFEGSRASGILEYGVVTLLAGRVVETKTRLCRASGRVRAEDTAVHGLREETVAAQAPLADDWEYFAGLRERGPLAAHYAGTENGLLKSVWPYPRHSPDFARPGARIVDWGPWIDSARLCAQLCPNLDSGRLEAVVAALGLQAELDALPPPIARPIAAGTMPRFTTPWPARCFSPRSRATRDGRS